MTRINVVPPSELSQLHLIAEYRELPRIFGMVRKYQSMGKRPCDIDIPPVYTLGTGHMKFFCDKLAWLAARQQSLINEMLRRGYRPNFSADNLLDGIDSEWIGDYVVTVDALVINRARIEERMKK